MTVLPCGSAIAQGREWDDTRKGLFQGRAEEPPDLGRRDPRELGVVRLK